jgi:hypothetical protein
MGLFVELGAAMYWLPRVHGRRHLHDRHSAAGPGLKKIGRPIPLSELPLRVQGCRNLLARLLLPHESGKARLGSKSRSYATGLRRRGIKERAARSESRQFLLSLQGPHDLPPISGDKFSVVQFVSNVGL